MCVSSLDVSVCVGSTQALIYGELARMFTQFGVQKTATTFLCSLLRQDLLSKMPPVAPVRKCVHCMLCTSAGISKLTA